MKMTSAEANKMLKQLEDEKKYWITKESKSMFYTASIKEEPIKPDYDYNYVSKRLNEIDDAIINIKHAVNLSNVSTTIYVNDIGDMTVDQILVSMAQKNKRKDILNIMRSHPEIQRVKNSGFGGPTSKDPEYEYANYDVEQARLDYDIIMSEITDMQLALDKHNQTYEFEVDI